MKKLAQATAFLLGLTLPALAQANESLPLLAHCKSLEDNQQFLETYNEYPFAGGPSVIRLPNDKLVEGVGKIYVDPQGKGFTVVIEFAEIDKSCALLMGDDFAPIQKEPNV